VKCPHCGVDLTQREMRRFPILYKRRMAVKWLRRHKEMWEGRLVCGGWRSDAAMTDAYKTIGIGLKFAGIYAKTTGLNDMPIMRLVREAKGI